MDMIEVRGSEEGMESDRKFLPSIFDLTDWIPLQFRPSLHQVFSPPKMYNSVCIWISNWTILKVFYAIHENKLFASERYFGLPRKCTGKTLVFILFYFFFCNKVTLLYYIYISVWRIYSHLSCVGGVCPVTVSLLVLCEDVLVAFSFEASIFVNFMFKD
jgi:hypothetical protein